MKLTFSDSPTIDELTFKRLLLLSTELIFVDRPSIQLADNFGTVGMPSGVANLVKEFEGSPVKLVVDEPPNSTFNSDFYRKYFEKDLKNSEFLNTIFDGIDEYWIYSHHFDPKQRRTSGEFQDYRNWILQNKELIKHTDIFNTPRPEQVFQITTLEEALFAFKILAAEESLRVTSVTHICNKYESNPASVNPYLNKLISLRLSDEIYSGRLVRSRQLGLKLIDCIIPDEALLQIPWQDLLIFREKTKDYFDNWVVEVNKLEASLFSNDLTDQEVINLFDTEVNPRLRELKNEIRRIRDERYANILKTIKNTIISGLAFGSLSSLSITGAIASFIGANLKTPKLTDDIIDANLKLKDKKLSNGLTYLLKLQELVDKQ
ncbi:hypothetical protein [Sphingobacterium mizutaii]|uniref:hypothetical protein n=1 Tax=Sphingobacterium mizutaii TaxID=1010 RepID=UPI0028993A84|nr:hypothetical protein [Sphingobacterium mizutaii]